MGLLIFSMGQDVTSFAQHTVTIDPSITYQTITAWEGTAYSGQDHPNFSRWRDELFEKVVDLGINRIRLEIRSGVENQQDYYGKLQQGEIDYPTWRSHRYATVNDDDDPSHIEGTGFHFTEFDETVETIVLPLKQRVEAAGKRFFINVNYVAFTGQIGAGLSYHHHNPQEYAEFVLAASIHLRDRYGLVPDTWEVILEPDNVSQWNGRLIGQAIAAAAPLLEKYGFTFQFVAPSATNMGNAISYFDGMIQIEGVVDHLAELSYHRYGGVSDANLTAIAQRAAQHRIHTAHLEWIGATYRELYKDLTLANNSSWAQFTLGGYGTNDDGGAYFLVNNPDSTNPTVRMGSRTRYLWHYLHFIASGAIRIEARSNTPRLNSAAFLNPDNRMVLVVNLNTPGDLTFTVTGLSGGVYGIQYTNAVETQASLPDTAVLEGDSMNITLPGAGVATIFQKETASYTDTTGEY